MKQKKCELVQKKMSDSMFNEANERLKEVVKAKHFVEIEMEESLLGTSKRLRD